ncbi:MAG: II family cellulose-binding protein [Nitrospirae bacterium GWD2_57_9]|nr:MAG: II family cellulose-binding protein [Nitrospirae bacterium GWD2_57_9]
MEIDVTTPALLFPAISLLLLAFTNRFLALAALIRNLHDRYQARPDELIVAQIGNLRYRVMLIKNMQAFGVLSLLLCVLCMFVLFAGNMLLGKAIFAISLVLMMISLVLSAREIQVSVNALNLQLKDLEMEARQK